MKETPYRMGNTTDWRMFTDEFECPACHGELGSVLSNMYKCVDCGEEFFINDIHLYEYHHVIKKINKVEDRI